MPKIIPDSAFIKILSSVLLPDSNSSVHFRFEDLKGSKGTLLIFLSNDCLFVQHALPEIIMIANDYRVQGIGVGGIYSEDSTENTILMIPEMAEFAFQNKIDFPYLYDRNQEFARILGAKCTPDFFLFDAEDELFYHGQIDDSRPGNGIPLGGNDLRAAIDALIYNRVQIYPQKPSEGCSINLK